jgi:thiol-disulfide isomerase/thioredoxin
VRKLGVTLIAIAALLAGFYLSAQHFAEPLPASLLSPNGNLIGSQRPEFRLGSHEGELVTPSDFSGKTLLVNFWATWCTPCRREMPMLMDLQREYGAEGLQVVGIALDDVQSVSNFVQKYGISYPILVGAADAMATSAAYGNVEGVLPYSVLVDRGGVIRWQYTGEIQEDDVSRLLSDLL